MTVSRTAVIGGLIGLTAAWSIGVPAARAEDTAQSLYEAAKKEGALVYWSSNDANMNSAIGAAFNAKYPGIKVQPFKIEPGPAIERIVTESTAGKVSVDVVDSPLSYLSPLLDRNLVEPYPWDSVFKLDPASLLFGNKFVEFYQLDVPIAVNTGMVAVDQIKSWEDLLDPKWRGKIILEARGIEFPMLSLVWGEDRTFDYLRKLLANKPVIVQGGTPTMEALAGGQGAVALGTYGGRVLEYQQNGAPVDWARVGPIAVMHYVAAPVKGAPHPNAARLWTAFLTTPEAGALLFKYQHFGMLTGPNADPLGKEMQKAGISLSFETDDLPKMRALLQKTGQIIKAGS